MVHYLEVDLVVFLVSSPDVVFGPLSRRQSCRSLDEYFKALIHHYGNSDKLIHDFEEYSKSNLRVNIDKLILKISKYSISSFDTMGQLTLQ